MGIGSDMYSGSASIGRISALMGAIALSVVALPIIGIGFYLMIKAPQKKGTPVAEEASDKKKERILGGVLIVGALIAVGFAWLMYYFTRKSKAFAALTGADDVAHAVSDII